MQMVMAVLAALAAAGTTFGLTVPPWQATAFHDDGTGYVAGADVRTATGWDGRTLQTNASSLEFVSESESVTGMSWDCVDTETADVLPQRTELVVTESRRIAAAPQILWWGTVAGFGLEGFDGTGASSAVLEGPAPNSCPAGPWTLVEGSARTVETPGEPVLLAVHDGVRHPLLVP